MAGQYRRRTKGKNAWVNVSASKKNGVNGSVSVKPSKSITFNSGNKIRPSRVTINLGKGFRYVIYGTKSAKRQEEMTNFLYLMACIFCLIAFFLYFPEYFYMFFS